jgi:hypothetical protein
MAENINDTFSGYQVEVKVPPISLSPHMRKIYLKEMAESTPQELRFKCIIAEATNTAFGAGGHSEDYADFQVGKKTFRVNPKAKAQFGRNYDGTPYLTIGLIETAHPEASRYRLTWVGDSIPHVMKEMAVAHDRGDNVVSKMVPLPLDTAELKISKPTVDKRPQGRETNIRKNANKGPTPRLHARICEQDL